MSSNTPESKVKAKIREIFKRYEVAYTHIPASQFGKAGAGDYICCVQGIYLEVEAKAGKGKLSKLQEIRREDVSKAGGLYIVVNELNLYILESLIKTLKVPQTYFAVLSTIQKEFCA